MSPLLTDYFNEDNKFIADLGKLYGLNVEEFIDHIILLLQRDVKGVTVGSIDSNLIGGQTKEMILAEAILALQIHASRTDNPHQETVDSIGTMSKEEIEALDITGIPIGHIPVDLVGWNTGTWTRDNLNTKFSVVGNTLKLNDDFVAIIYGRPTVIKKQTLTIPSTGANELYLFIELDKGLPGIKLVAEKLPDKKHRIFLTKFNRTTNLLSGITPIIRISGRRISEVPVGDGIPATPGSYMTTTKLLPGWIPGSNRTELPGLVWGGIKIVSDSIAAHEFRYNNKLMLTVNKGEELRFRIQMEGEVQNISVTSTIVNTANLTMELVDPGDQTLYNVKTDNVGFSKVVAKSVVAGKSFEETVYIRVTNPLIFNLMSTDMPHPDRGQIGPLPPISRFSPKVGDPYVMNFSASESVTITMTGLDNLWPRVYSLSGGTSPKINFNFNSRYTASVYITAMDVSGRNVLLGPYTIAADIDEPPTIQLYCRAYMHTPDHADFWRRTPGAAWYSSTKNEPASNTVLNIARWTVEFYELPASHFISITMKSCITSRNHYINVTQGVNRKTLEITPIWNGVDPGGIPSVHYFICEAEVQNGIGAKVTEEFYIRFVRR